MGGLGWAEKRKEEEKPKPKPKVGSVRMAKWRMAYGGMEWHRLSDKARWKLTRLGDSVITWPQPYVIVMMSSQHILGRCVGGGRWAQASGRQGVKASRRQGQSLSAMIVVGGWC